MISFQPFFKYIKAHNIRQYSLLQNGIIGSQTLNNMKHNKSISTNIIDRLCAALDCTPADIFEYIPTPGEETAPSAEALPPAPGEEPPARSSARTATDGAAQDTNT